MTDVCGDNRFKIIAEAKKDLIESTNIEMSQDEMAVLDNFLFRCWQMGWLRRYDKGPEQKALIVTDALYKERTAKVENIQVEWGDDEYVNDRMGAMYYYGDCGNCGKTVSHNQKYCHECGARLEWK